MWKLFYWMVDYLYLIRGNTIMYMRRKPPKHYLGYTVEGKVPVVIIPGLTMKWGFMRKLGNAISTKGHPVYIIPIIGNNLSSIPETAKVVRELIDANDLHNIVIVAHSKGGLIGKYLLVHDNKDKRIEEVIAIATPFSGSSLGRFVPMASFKELTPNSELIKELDANKTVNSKIISIIPAFDNHVRSEKGSYLEGADNIDMSVKGHHKILFSNDLQKKVIEAINKVTTKV